MYYLGGQKDMPAKTSGCEKRIDRERVLDLAFFFVLFFVAAVANYRLFLHQALEQGTAFPSDIKAYILEIQGLNDTYSFPYPIIFWLAGFIKLFTTPERAMALATTLLNCLAMIALKWEMSRALLEDTVMQSREEKAKTRRIMADCMTSMVSVAMFFASMLILPGNLWLPGVKFRCIGVFTPNPYYNATYMAARPFAIVSFFSFFRLLGKYEKEENFPGKKEDFGECMIFAVSLLIATMAKPSFTIILVGAAGLNMLAVLFISRFKKFLSTILLGLCFIPTFLALLYQYSGVFVSKEEAVEAGIGFCFGDIWHVYCNFIPSAIAMGMCFPILVLLLNFKELKTKVFYRFSWELYAMSFVMAYFLYEKGFRKNDFNFAWGYMYGIFFGFIGALLLVMKDTMLLFAKDQSSVSKPIWKNGRFPVLVLEWIAFLAHVISGLIYFSWISAGASYF